MEEGLGGRIEMSPQAYITPALGSHNTTPRWVTCQLCQLDPQQLPTLWIFNGSSPLFSFYTWRRPCLSFIRLLAVYGYMGNLLCPCHTLLRKVRRAQRRGERDSVLLSITPVSPVLLLPVRILEFLTQTQTWGWPAYYQWRVSDLKGIRFLFITAVVSAPWLW